MTTRQLEHILTRDPAMQQVLHDALTDDTRINASHSLQRLYHVRDMESEIKIAHSPNGWYDLFNYFTSIAPMLAGFIALLAEKSAGSFTGAITVLTVIGGIYILFPILQRTLRYFINKKMNAYIQQNVQIRGGTETLFGDRLLNGYRNQEDEARRKSCLDLRMAFAKKWSSVLYCLNWISDDDYAKWFIYLYFDWEAQQN